MNLGEGLLKPLLRGRAATGALARFGIDPRRYWLLVDLFAEISERGEIMDQLGWNGASMKAAAWLYFAISTLLALLLMAGDLSLMAYSTVFLVMTAFLLLMVLLSEAGNSLVNPAEGLVLAHHPIDGATYTAAKLSHLVRIVVYLVPGLNAAPAVAGLALRGAGWWFPVVHMAGAFLVGMLAALLCCATYGWLLRLIPTSRLKATAQIASAAPLLGVFVLNSSGLTAHIRVEDWMPARAGARLAIGIAVCAGATGIVMLGIRSLSADFLIRVSSIAHGRSRAHFKKRQSRIADLVARLCGGPGSRAAYAYVSRMALRDYQFRKQMALVMPGVIVGVAGAVKGTPVDPFSGGFSVAHLMPHLFGTGMLVICSILSYGNDYRGAWIFQLAPVTVFGPFARGVYAFLLIGGVVLPNGILFLGLVWFWGIWHAALFAVFSAAVSSAYLALTLRLVDGIPFSRQLEPARNVVMLPALLLAGFVAALAAALQHFIVFRSEAAVLLTAAGIGAASYALTRWSLRSLEAEIRFGLDLISGESRLIYKEIEA